MAVVMGVALAVFLLHSPRSVDATRIAVIAAAVATTIVLALAGWQASAAARRAQDRVSALRDVSSHSQEELRQVLAERDLARQAQILARSQPLGGRHDQPLEVFVNIARRLQSLVHREIQLLDDIEGQVEDPDLLKGLFMVDHLATRTRRQSESLAVLGGAVSRRQWNRPVPVFEVLRAAIAEVEFYARAKVVPPVTGTLAGNAVADVIHLLAELIENATKFSAPETMVYVRTQVVTAGMVIEVEDRGLGMLPEDLARMNALLADTSRADPSDLLRDGRIGLFVVSALARRHDIRLQLQANIYGGVQAVAVLPHRLVNAGQPERPAPDRVAAGPAATATGPMATAGPAVAEARRAVTVATAESPRQPGSVAPGAAGTAAARTEAAERPPLPTRRPLTHMAPQLREAPSAQRDESDADLNPGLMAAFRSGINRAEQEDDSPDRESPGH